ncbi:C40 family peptidase [Kineococcus sp. TBRC 1896]|uniref:C40 family peptidase n=1 Tax=Kineococcus mangrovi TaxID=1660183 RepID=A0ABV4I7V8_9ACTN
MKNFGRVVAAGALALALAVPAAGAHAEPRSETLQAQADALRTSVEALRLQQSIATEAYDTAIDDTARAISQEVRAQAVLDAATGTSSAAATAATRRVRTLYMAGPALPTGLSSGLGLLTGGTLDRAADTARSAAVAATVVADDRTTLTRAVTARADAIAAEADLQEVRREKTAAQRAAQTAQAEVTTALARQQDLLDSADAAVRRAVADEEEAARQAALAAAAQQAAAAGVADATGETAGVADAVADASTAALGAIAAAHTREGVPYAWGATGPSTFDCSGLTQWAYAQAGVSIPRTSRQQYAGLPRVPLDQLQPGDLVFYANGSDPSTIHHVALYLGGGKVLHAPHTGDVVRVAGVAMPGLFGAVRPS